MHIFHFKCSNKTLLETFDSPRVYGIQNDADEIISRVALRHIKFCKIKQQVYCADFHMNIFDFSFKLFTFPSILIPESIFFKYEQDSNVENDIIIIKVKKNLSILFILLKSKFYYFFYFKFFFFHLNLTFFKKN